tara:strand:+ start:347 stop:904 length:558 start_codon:yes stop_codon:yes gene_type:complete
MAKHKQLLAAQKGLAAWKKTKGADDKKPKATAYQEGKCQVELTEVLFGKDKWGNTAFNFEGKILNGPDVGRTLQHSLPLEATSSDGSKTPEQLKEWTGWALEALYKNLSAIGLDTVDRDEVENISGAIIEIAFWRGKGEKWPATRWPKVFFQKLVTPPPGEEAEEVATPADASDDEYDYEEIDEE